MIIRLLSTKAARGSEDSNRSMITPESKVVRWVVAWLIIEKDPLIVGTLGPR